MAELVKNCHQKGVFPLRIAIADTAAGAWALAHFGGPNDRTTAPANVPEGISYGWILPPGDNLRWLQFLPVEALHLSQDITRWCHELGVRRIGDLIRIPMAELRERFGEILVFRLEQLLGKRKEVLFPCTLPPRFEAEKWFDFAVTAWEMLEVALLPLLQQLSQEMIAHRVGALQAEVTFFCDNASKKTMSVGMFRPTCDPRRIWELMELAVEQQFSGGVPSPIIGLRIVLPQVGPLECYQASFFGDKDSKTALPEGEYLLERLAARLGDERVCRAIPRADHEPESANEWRPWLCYRVGHRSTSPSLGKIPAGARPTRLLATPCPLHVTLVVPCGRPYRIEYRNQFFSVHRSWGPERIETGWWRGHYTARDYYRIELENGAHWWIYRRLEDGRWFLHGTFG